MRRLPSGRVRLSVPPDRVAKFCERMGYGTLAPAWSVHRPQLLHASDAEIILTYNAELRGFATYYALSGGAKSALRTLYYVWRGSLLKTLAKKHQTSVVKELQRLRQGPRHAISFQVDGKSRTIGVWRLADLNSKPVPYGTVDEVPKTQKYTGNRTEVIERLLARECEYCGNTDVPCQVHHVRKMKDMQGSPLWLWLKAARSRKRVVLCKPCHQDLHLGRLPDHRYQQHGKWRAVCGESRTHGSEGGTRVSSVATRRLEL
jgi:hypothetical protein